MYGKWHDRGLEVLSSCISQNDEQYGYDIYSLNLPWAEVRDARGMKNTLIDKFALTGNLPAGLLIGRDGTIPVSYTHLNAGTKAVNSVPMPSFPK